MICRKMLLRPKNWDRKDLDRRKERRLHVVPPPTVPTSTTTSKLPQCQPMPPTKPHGNNTTIIRLSESGTVINNTLIPHTSAQQTTTGSLPIDPSSYRCSSSHHQQNNENNTNKVNIISSNMNGAGHLITTGSGTKIADICFVTRQCATKTVTVEVHRGPTSATDEQTPSKVPPPPPMGLPMHGRSPSSLSSTSSTPSSMSDAGNVSLSSAISDELKKRAEV